MSEEASQREARKAAQAKGRHTRQHKPEGGTQASRRLREASKPAGGKGRHARDAEVRYARARKGG